MHSFSIDQCKQIYLPPFVPPFNLTGMSRTYLKALGPWIGFTI